MIISIFTPPIRLFLDVLSVSLLHEIYRCDYIVNFRMLMRRNGVGLVLNNLLKLKHVVNLKEEQVNKLNKDTEY